MSCVQPPLHDRGRDAGAPCPAACTAPAVCACLGHRCSGIVSHINTYIL